MPSYFPIIEVPHDAALGPEQMGTKQKFWFRHQQLGECLFKRARPATGEDWSEKLACELAEVLGVPHARYELAQQDGHPGVVSPTFVPQEYDLIHGNELLGRVDPSYPTHVGENRYLRVPEHTLAKVLATLGELSLALPLGWAAPAEISSAIDVFVGFLALDAWIGNTDRHHENWAALTESRPRPGTTRALHLAPSYDHASCLGRELSDDQRARRLVSRDTRFTVEVYASKARSGLYARGEDARPLSPLDAFRLAAEQRSIAGRYWLGRLGALDERAIDEVLSRFPPSRMSEPARNFVVRLLKFNASQLALVAQRLPE